MIKNKKISLAGCDKTMLLIIALLLTYGSLMVFSASAPYAESTYGDEYYFVKRQLFWVTLGLIGLTVCALCLRSFIKIILRPLVLPWLLSVLCWYFFRGAR